MEASGGNYKKARGGKVDRPLQSDVGGLPSESNERGWGVCTPSIRIRRASTAPLKLSPLLKAPSEPGSDGEDSADGSSRASLSPLKHRLQQFGSRLEATSSSFLLSEAEELWGAARPLEGESKARLLSDTGLPRCLDAEIYDLFADLETETDAEKLRGRLGALGFWFTKLEGDLSLWVARAVSLQRRVDVLVKQQEQQRQQQQRQQAQHEALTKKQMQDLTASRHERDELLEQLYWLRRSLEATEAAKKAAEEKALSACSNTDADTRKGRECGQLELAVRDLKAERDELVGKLFYQQEKTKELQQQLNTLKSVCHTDHLSRLEQQQQQLEAAANERQQLQSQLIQCKIKYAESAFEELGARQGALQRAFGAAQAPWGPPLSPKAQGEGAPQLSPRGLGGGPFAGLLTFRGLRHKQETGAAPNMAAAFVQQQQHPFQMEQQQQQQQQQQPDGSTYYSPRGPIPVKASSSPFVPPLQLQMLQQQSLSQQQQQQQQQQQGAVSPREEKGWSAALGGGTRKLFSRILGKSAKDLHEAPGGSPSEHSQLGPQRSLPLGHPSCRDTSEGPCRAPQRRHSAEGWAGASRSNNSSSNSSTSSSQSSRSNNSTSHQSSGSWEGSGGPACRRASYGETRGPLSDSTSSEVQKGVIKGTRKGEVCLPTLPVSCITGASPPPASTEVSVSYIPLSPYNPSPNPSSPGAAEKQSAVNVDVHIEESPSSGSSEKGTEGNPTNQTNHLKDTPQNPSKREPLRESGSPKEPPRDGQARDGSPSDGAAGGSGGLRLTQNLKTFKRSLSNAVQVLRRGSTGGSHGISNNSGSNNGASSRNNKPDNSNNSSASSSNSSNSASNRSNHNASSSTDASPTNVQVKEAEQEGEKGDPSREQKDEASPSKKEFSSDPLAWLQA